MKISFPSTACDSLDFHAIVAVAQRSRFDAVELPAIRTPTVATACNALFTATDKICQAFADAHVKISAIDVGENFDELPQRIALARQLDCHVVRLVLQDTTSPSVIDRLIAAGDAAAASQITIVIENEPVTGSFLKLWRLLDRLSHPSIGCCWNTMLAAEAGDSPAVAIATLNSKIRYVVMQDAKMSAGPMTCCNLGEGELPLRKTTDRLRGIGFGGYLLVGLNDQLARDMNQLERTLTAARTVLQQWRVVPKPSTG